MGSEKLLTHTVYEDANGNLCAMNSVGDLFYNDHTGPVGFVHSPESLRDCAQPLKPRPDLSYGFYKKETTNGA